MRTTLHNLKKLGQWHKAPSAGKPMLPGGAHQVNHHMHIPVPGRLQYYRAETLPFLPNEIKTQLRFPKAYAKSEPSMRYLEQVREQTRQFVNAEITHNYFSGETGVDLNATLAEAEVLFGASDEVKAMAASGQLSQLLASFNSAAENAQS